MSSDKTSLPDKSKGFMTFTRELATDAPADERVKHHRHLDLAVDCDRAEHVPHAVVRKPGDRVGAAAGGVAGRVVVAAAAAGVTAAGASGGGGETAEGGDSGALSVAFPGSVGASPAAVWAGALAPKRAASSVNI